MAAILRVDVAELTVSQEGSAKRYSRYPGTEQIEQAMVFYVLICGSYNTDCNPLRGVSNPRGRGTNPIIWTRSFSTFCKGYVSTRVQGVWARSTSDVKSILVS